jgi:N-carbamoyl-L-amino-acid hydrolase
MSLRHDAAYCAAKAAVFVRDLAKQMGGSQVATVGSVRLVPNLVNVIARQATFTVDLRNTDETLLRDAESELANFLHDLARDEQVSIDARQLARTEPVRFSDQVLSLIERAAQDLGCPIRRMTSGAGHDAQMMARICPTAMIFVPSVGGISHNPKEHTAPEHVDLGANLLLRTLQLLANQ